MPGLKKHHADFTFSGNRVTPDEYDEILSYQVQNPAVAGNFYGTAASASAVAVGLTNVKADYPRNVRLTILGVAGGMGGTGVVNGYDQFGRYTTETLGFATANAGGTVSGTKIFAEISSATVTPVGAGGTAVGTITLGVASGTAAGITTLFGLPWKIKAITDVKSITWINQGTVTAVGGGTITSSLVNTSSHSFMGTSVVAITDAYVVRVKPTYDSSNDAAVV